MPNKIYPSDWNWISFAVIDARDGSIYLQSRQRLSDPNAKVVGYLAGDDWHCSPTQFIFDEQGQIRQPIESEGPRVNDALRKLNIIQRENLANAYRAVFGTEFDPKAEPKAVATQHFVLR